MSLVWLLRNLPMLAVGLACSLLVFGGMKLLGDRGQLAAKLEQAQRQLTAALVELERAEEAARVHRAHLARAAEEERRWILITNDLQQMEGQDAPLSPLLGHTAERLYPHSP
ncbi:MULTISPECIES: hypothetical protein [unclassified Pseudophaeobacter]|uniref:hypothetical protein n=1 Tax=unclassified Pseudophaeobacter TaxID=2637024 RepID=UPI000EFB707C|nr:hypothetical protein [Pseudophaeobacter sp. EL27]